MLRKAACVNTYKEKSQNQTYLIPECQSECMVAMDKLVFLWLLYYIISFQFCDLSYLRNLGEESIR